MLFGLPIGLSSNARLRADKLRRFGKLIAGIFIGIALAGVEVILGFRLGFLLANANPNNGFVDFIYDISDPLTDPFQSIVSNRSVDGGVFEPASVIAMLVYLVAGALLIALVLAMANALAPHGDRVVSSRRRHRERVAHED